MSIEKITTAIIDEATAESEQILNSAAIKSSGVIDQLKKRIKIETEEAVAAAKEEREKIISRRKSVADIDAKKIVLQKKQELIDKSFDDAIESLLSMEEGKYIDFLANLGKSSGFKEGNLIFNEKERDAIGEKVVAKLQADVTGGQFKLSQETRNLKGGYMLQKGQIYINNSVEAIVDEKRQELTGDVASIMFPPEK